MLEGFIADFQYISGLQTGIIFQAVCCSDHVHCCPHGYACDVSHSKCNLGNTKIDWFKKEVAIKVGNVICDSTHECPNGNTCCKLASGKWGCCQIPNVSRSLDKFAMQIIIPLQHKSFQGYNGISLSVCPSVCLRIQHNIRSVYKILVTLCIEHLVQFCCFCIETLLIHL